MTMVKYELKNFTNTYPNNCHIPDTTFCGCNSFLCNSFLCSTTDTKWMHDAKAMSDHTFNMKTTEQI